MNCLYHANCTDGEGAALAVWTSYGDKGNSYIPCHYGDPIPDGLAGSNVIMVDYSMKRDQIIKLAGIAKSIAIIDHHKTAEAELIDLPENVRVKFDMEKSGAVLAWEHFVGTDVPQLIKHIQDRDLWKFDLAGTKDIITGLKLGIGWRGWLHLDLGELRKSGTAINRFLKIKSNEIIANKPRVWDITGDTVPLYNLPGFMISDTLHLALYKYPDAPYAVAYFDIEGKRIYSLRSRSSENVDVSEIAKQHGGGGHKCAAGFGVGNA